MNPSVKMVLTFILFAAATSVHAHLIGNHAMSITEGVHHLITSPSHWWILLPALAIVLLKQLVVQRYRKR